MSDGRESVHRDIEGGRIQTRLEGESRTVLLEPWLVIRESTAPATERST
jgi:hypothetical protein